MFLLFCSGSMNFGERVVWVFGFFNSVRFLFAQGSNFVYLMKSVVKQHF
jgi:hypothetical protein